MYHMWCKTQYSASLETLAIGTAAALGKQLFIWNSFDTYSNGQGLSRNDRILVHKQTNYNTSAKTDNGVSSHGLMVFYIDCVYKFTSSTHKNLGVVTNGECLGSKLMLNQNEPQFKCSDAIV